MTRIRQHAIIDASPEEVWAVVSNPRHLPRWNRYIRAVHDVPEDGLRPGDRYWTEMGGFGVRFKVRAEVLEVDPPHYARVRLTGPFEAVVRTWVRPAGPRRARLEHEVEYSVRGGPIGAVVARALRVLGAPQVLKRGIRAQKRQVES
jgi:uncharacterized membrane protein